jgi:hypothetical protein
LAGRLSVSRPFTTPLVPFGKWQFRSSQPSDSRAKSETRVLISIPSISSAEPILDVMITSGITKIKPVYTKIIKLISTEISYFYIKQMQAISRI